MKEKKKELVSKSLFFLSFFFRFYIFDTSTLSDHIRWQPAANIKNFLKQTNTYSVAVPLVLVRAAAVAVVSTICMCRRRHSRCFHFFFPFILALRFILPFLLDFESIIYFPLSLTIIYIRDHCSSQCKVMSLKFPLIPNIGALNHYFTRIDDAFAFRKYQFVHWWWASLIYESIEWFSMVF